MHSGQSGIFALGSGSHAYPEFDLKPGIKPLEMFRAIASLRAPRITTGGVNLVVGLRPELWASVAPDQIPPDVEGFNRPVQGLEGFSMPATQHDLWLWVAGHAYERVFDAAREAISALAASTALADETHGWTYKDNRDLTGFIDGTENPSLAVAPEVALVPDGSPGAAGSVVLERLPTALACKPSPGRLLGRTRVSFAHTANNVGSVCRHALVQEWVHDAAAWEALPVREQEKSIGRTKDDSTELSEEARGPHSHVSRNVIEEHGEEQHIFRRNTPFGTPMVHGTMFVGFSADQHRLARMLRRMAGAEDGIRDALTDYTTAVTGAYYFVPSVQALRGFAAEDK